MYCRIIMTFVNIKTSLWQRKPNAPSVQHLSAHNQRAQVLYAYRKWRINDLINHFRHLENIIIRVLYTLHSYIMQSHPLLHNSTAALLYIGTYIHTIQYAYKY